MQFDLMSRPRLGSVLRAAILCAGFSFAGVPALAQSGQGEAVTQAHLSQQEKAAGDAARQGLARFVQGYRNANGGGLPTGFPLDISDVNELGKARVTYGFQIYTIDPQDIVSGRSELSAVAKPTGAWRFVVGVGSRPVGLITVEQVGGKWEAVSYGGAELAKDVDAQRAVHGNADRSNLRFVRIFQARSDFLEVVSPKDFRSQYAPLHSARQSLRLQSLLASTNGLIDQADLVDPLRTAVKENLEAFR